MKRLFHYLVKITTILGILLACGGLTLLLFYPSYLAAIIEYIKEIILTLGRKNYLLVVIICIVESIPFFNVIFPGAIFTIVIGWFVAQSDYFGITWIVIICTIIGDSLAFRIWKRNWNSILSAYGNIIWITPDLIEKFKTTMKKHSHLAIFASKWTNYTRGIIPFFSGLSHTKRINFIWLNALGSLVYWCVIIWLAKIFLWNYELVLPYLRIIATIVLVWTWLWYLISYYVNTHKNR